MSQAVEDPRRPRWHGQRRRAWSEVELRLQLAMDSTSLGEFKTCPRKYQLGIQLGWTSRSKSVDLIFGGLVHTGFETYHRSRAQGADHEEGVTQAFRRVMLETWDRELGRPKANLDDSIKNRLSLARAIIWGLDETQRADGEDPLKTHILADGTPAIELSFRLPAGYRSRLTGEDFLLCGHLDRVVEFLGRLYIEDVKSTRHPLDARWLESFTPDNQFSLYPFAGQLILHQPIEGLIVSGIQIGQSFVRGPRRQLVPRSPSYLAEWHQGLGLWLRWLEDCVETDVWPQNDKACFRCDFRSVCSRPPEARQARLEADFVRTVWDPLIPRAEAK